MGDGSGAPLKLQVISHSIELPIGALPNDGLRYNLPGWITGDITGEIPARNSREL